MPTPRQRLILFDLAAPAYLLRDNFDDVLAAGSVNGMPARPGPGTRTVTDAESKLSLSGGVLSISGGKAAPAYGDPGLWYGAIARAAGRVLLGKLTIADVTNSCEFGWDTAAAGAISAHALRFASDAVNVYAGGAAGPVIATPVDATEYQLAAVLRSTGVYWYIKGGAFTYWTLLWVGSTDNTATLYPAISNYNAVLTADNIRVPTGLWLPTPLCYDTFTRADGALGNSEAVGPDGQAVGALAWTGAAFAIATNKAVGTPTQGAELLANPGFEGVYVGGLAPNWINSLGDPVAESADAHGGVAAQQVTTVNASGRVVSGNFTLAAGTWLQLAIYAKRTAGTAGMIRFAFFDGVEVLALGTYNQSSYTYYVGTARTRVANTTHVQAARNWGASPGDTVIVDDCSVVALTLSTLFASVVAASANVVADVDVVLTANTQAGLVLNLDSAASPANFLLAYVDSTNAYLAKCVSGSYTTLISAAVTYGAGKTLRVVKDGTSVNLFYGGAKVGTTQTVSDAGIISNTLHGLFSTYASNTLDNFTVMARGNGNEYSALDAM